MRLRRQLRATGRSASGVYEYLPAGDILGNCVVNLGDLRTRLALPACGGSLCGVWER